MATRYFIIIGAMISISETMQRLEELLQGASERESESIIAAAKEYAKLTETVCADLMTSPGGVDKCIGIWQKAHVLIFNLEKEEISGSELCFRHPEFILFLCSFAAFFAKLASPNKEFNDTLLHKRIQIYQQALKLLDLYTEHDFPNELTGLNRELLRHMGTCWFKLQNMDKAYENLLQVVNTYALPSLIATEHASAVMKYCEALLEATECLKVKKQFEDAIQNYKRVLQLYDTLHELGSEVRLDCVGGVCNNIAMCYYHLFEYKATIPYFERALAAYESVYGPNVAAVVTIRGNIATNKQLAAMMEQMPEGTNITKMDLTNPRPMDATKEKEMYFTVKK